MGKDTELQPNCKYENKLEAHFFKNVKYHLIFTNIFLIVFLNLLNCCYVYI